MDPKHSEQTVPGTVEASTVQNIIRKGLKQARGEESGKDLTRLARRENGMSHATTIELIHKHTRCLRNSCTGHPCPLDLSSMDGAAFTMGDRSPKYEPTHLGVWRPVCSPLLYPLPTGEPTSLSALPGPLPQTALAGLSVSRDPNSWLDEETQAEY